MPKDFWRKINKPIIALAPMDGYSDSAFRRVCKMVNPNIIVFTEFTSADGLHHGAKKLQDKFRYDPSEHPIVAQIFGKNTETFVTAAKYCEAQGFDGIDINMGCPSKKVVKSEHGVALRKKPELAFKLVEAVAEATSLPISVKTRLGWNNAEDLIGFGKSLENAGTNMITIHGRTYSEPYGVPAHFEPIYELKKNVTIPVIGNGGITSIADGKNKLGNLDGFMIGQASFGNPWVFSESPAPSFAGRISLIKKHAKLLFELKGEKVAMLEIRKHLLHYVKGLPNASLYRSQLVQVKSLNEIELVLRSIVP
jgi:tRNA-dihydrouridine synthase B